MTPHTPFTAPFPDGFLHLHLGNDLALRNRIECALYAAGLSAPEATAWLLCPFDPARPERTPLRLIGEGQGRLVAALLEGLLPPPESERT